ncbi:MAG: hypothetical protein K1X63_15445 [Chitinophagales bacterium]|nr:hypothetical protein [Chitinophagales bacterium]
MASSPDGRRKERALNYSGIGKRGHKVVPVSPFEILHSNLSDKDLLNNLRVLKNDSKAAPIHLELVIRNLNRAKEHLKDFKKKDDKENGFYKERNIVEYAYFDDTAFKVGKLKKIDRIIGRINALLATI